MEGGGARGLYTTGIVRIKIIIIIIIKVGPLPVGLRAIRGATLDNSVFMTGQGAIWTGDWTVMQSKMDMVLQA